MSTRAYIAAQLLNAGFFVISGGLTIACLREIATSRASKPEWSRQRKALLAFVAIMGALSVAAIVYDSVRFIAFVQYLTDVLYHGMVNNPIRYFEDDMLRAVLPLTVWGAELFMIWRMYEHAHPSNKFEAFLVGGLAMALLSLSIASSIPVFSYAPRLYHYGEFLSTYRFFSISAAVINLIMSVFIAVRLIIWDRVFEGVEPTPTAYGKVVIHVLVSSGAPLTLCAVLSGSFFKVWVHDFMVIPIFVMPQISIISPLLIVNGLLTQPDEGVIRLEDTSIPDHASDAHANA